MYKKVWEIILEIFKHEENLNYINIISWKSCNICLPRLKILALIVNKS